MVENQKIGASMAGSAKNAQRKVNLANFSLKHDDFVHDVQFDHYGRRIATCSSDQNIKVWERAADIDYADTSCNPTADRAVDLTMEETAK